MATFAIFLPLPPMAPSSSEERSGTTRRLFFPGLGGFSFLSFLSFLMGATVEVTNFRTKMTQIYIGSVTCTNPTTNRRRRRVAALPTDNKRGAAMPATWRGHAVRLLTDAVEVPYGTFTACPRHHLVLWTCRGGTVRHLHGTSTAPSRHAWGRKWTNATAMAQTCRGHAVWHRKAVP